MRRSAREETVMRKMALMMVIATSAVVASIGSSLARMDDSDRLPGGGAVVPCSLVGVNPALHKEIFGNPAVAASYGFARSSDGSWHVVPNCHR
jgi:hypothetical protein